MKKLISLLLCIILCVTVFAVCASAAYAEPYECTLNVYVRNASEDDFVILTQFGEVKKAYEIFNGKVEMWNVEPGFYWLSVYHEGIYTNTLPLWLYYDQTVFVTIPVWRYTPWRMFGM